MTETNRPGSYDEQHNSANQREGAHDGRDKVIVGGRDVHAEKLNRLSGCREADAGIGQHHDAERDQQDRNDGFRVHRESPVGSFLGG